MNVQACSRCGYGVYPAEKISCIDQISDQEDDKHFKSAFHWDMKSKDGPGVPDRQPLMNERGYWPGYGEGNGWSPGALPDPEIVRMVETRQALGEGYTEDYGQQGGKGSFPAMITPAYERAKKANQLASQVEYKRGHDERISRFTTVADTPELLRAKAGGQLQSEVRYTEDCEQQRGKGSFPAMITPAYQIAKRANELASDVKYHQQYQREMRGMAGSAAGAEGVWTKEYTDQYGQGYLEECEEPRGKGSFPAMITPAYQNAKKANELASDIKYRQDFHKMKGAAHYHALPAQDNLVLKRAQSVNKLVSENKYKENYQNHMRGRYEGVGMDRRTLHALKVGSLASNVAYKADYKHDIVDYNYPATLTPSYQTTMKLVPLKEVNYRQSIDKLKYSSVASTPQMVQAKINAQQLSHVNYRADYEKNKLNYTLPQDVPQMVKAKTNAELFSEVKYKEGWEKTKGRGFEMKLDAMSLLAAKASGELASNIKYKEEYEKTKGKAIGTTDSRLLHSLQVAKMSSEVEYKKGFEESKTHFHLPMDMVNIRHAKKAQALASDLDYRKKLHEYTTLPEDLRTQWAKKVYGLQSEKGYRQRADEQKFTSVADSSQMEHAKKSQELQSEVAYKAGHKHSLHQYSISKDEPLFLQARANAAQLSEKLYKSSWENQKVKGFELRLDSLTFLAAKAKRDLASEVKYKEDYERSRGKLIGAKNVQGDSQMSHSLQMSKLQSELEYKRSFEDTKSQCHISLDMIHLAHAQKAQHLATDIGYRTVPHQFTALPTDMKLEWAKKAYGLQSDNQYRADVKWMKGTGWVATGSLNVEQAKKAGELISEKKYRQHPDALKFTSIKDTPEMVQARISYTQAVDRLYKEQGENIKHRYTQTADLPEVLLAKLNAMNISEVRLTRRIQVHGWKSGCFCALCPMLGEARIGSGLESHHLVTHNHFEPGTYAFVCNDKAADDKAGLTKESSLLERMSRTKASALVPRAFGGAEIWDLCRAEYIQRLCQGKTWGFDSSLQ